MAKRAAWGVGLLLVAVGVVMAGRRKAAAPQAVASASAAVSAAPPSRCAVPSEGAAVTIGDAKGESEEEDAMPFAAEIGGGVALPGGFAVGLLQPDGRGAQAAVLRVDATGQNAKTIALGSAHGDTPPPKPFAKGDALGAALLEAGPSGRRLRLGRIDGDALTWGASFEQGRDESLAFDAAVGELTGVAAWDDDEGTPARGVIRVATFQWPVPVATAAPRTVTGKTTDAETPRVIPRPGGFWLLWIARRPELTDDAQREPGEEAAFRWLEAVALDPQGLAVGPPRRVSPAEGHVLAYDVQTMPEGHALVVYRDDDTPSGSSGGAVMRVVLRLDGSFETASPMEVPAGLGAPTLLPGWLAVADATSETRLAALGAAGELVTSLDKEPVLGLGEPVAAADDRLFVARPGGHGVRLFVTTCTRR